MPRAYPILKIFPSSQNLEEDVGLLKRAYPTRLTRLYRGASLIANLSVGENLEIVARHSKVTAGVGARQFSTLRQWLQEEGINLASTASELPKDKVLPVLLARALAAPLAIPLVIQPLEPHHDKEPTPPDNDEPSLHYLQAAAAFCERLFIFDLCKNSSKYPSTWHSSTLILK